MEVEDRVDHQDHVHGRDREVVDEPFQEAVEFLRVETGCQEEGASYAEEENRGRVADVVLGHRHHSSNENQHLNENVDSSQEPCEPELLFEIRNSSKNFTETCHERIQ